MIDIHSHTNFSPDSIELPENIVKSAIEKGCKVLGFSEHLDYDYVVDNIEVILTDVKAYYENTQKLKKLYKDEIKLLFGIEFGYEKKAEPYYLDVLKEYDFDYVINSVHEIDCKDCFNPAYFEGRTKQEAYTLYLNRVLQSTDAEFDFQIIGHIGYVTRYAPYEDKALYYHEFKDILDKILDKIIQKQKVLEFNTNIKSPVTLTLPTVEIIKRYYELGGRLISYGSDCHNALRLCENYDYVKNLLKETGFKEFVYFEKKEIKFYKL